jgi:hypothetical protein
MNKSRHPAALYMRGRTAVSEKEEPIHLPKEAPRVAQHPLCAGSPSTIIPEHQLLRATRTPSSDNVDGSIAHCVDALISRPSNRVRPKNQRRFCCSRRRLPRAPAP